MGKLSAPDISYGAIGRIALPLWIANVAIIGGGTIDTIMAGRLGNEDLAGVALGAASMSCVFLGLAGVLNGLSPIVGHHYGARKFSKIGYELSQSLWLAAVLSVIGMFILGNTGLWTGLARVTGRVRDVAEIFLIVSVLGIPAVLGCRAFVSVFSAVSKPKITMYVSIGTLILKTPLNLIFMYGWFGGPHLGGAGAAISSTISVWLSLIIYAIVWKKDPFYHSMQCLKWFWPNMKAIAAQLRIGVPIGISTFFETSCFALLAILMGRFGPVMLSAHQIVGNLVTLCYMTPLSIGITSSVLVAQSLGARHPETAYQAMKNTLKCSTAIAVCASLILYFGRDALLRIFTDEAAVIAAAGPLIFFGALYQVFDCIQSVSSFALRGYRVTLLPMVFYGVFLWGVGIFGGYYLAFHARIIGGPFGGVGLWAACAIGLFLIAVLLLGYAIYIGRARLKENEQEAR